MTAKSRDLPTGLFAGIEERPYVLSYRTIGLCRAMKTPGFRNFDQSPAIMLSRVKADGPARSLNRHRANCTQSCQAVADDRSSSFRSLKDDE